MSLLVWVGLPLAFLVLALTGICAYGSKRWTDAMRALTRRLEAARLDDKARSASPMRFDSRELEGLPGPVQRYFRAVLKEGQPIVSALTIDMACVFSQSTTAEHWKPFTSRQRIVTCRPGFLWNAQMSMLPGRAPLGRLEWTDRYERPERSNTARHRPLIDQRHRRDPHDRFRRIRVAHM